MRLKSLSVAGAIGDAVSDNVAIPLQDAVEADGLRFLISTTMIFGTHGLISRC